jgi:hypothetical protein
MTNEQTAAAYKLATTPAVNAAHDLMARAGDAFEFSGSPSGWIESHVVSAPEQGSAEKIYQGAVANMAAELANRFTDLCPVPSFD